MASSLPERVERYRSYLLKIAKSAIPSNLQAKAGASDIVQETIIAACQELSEARKLSSEEMRAWLRTILDHRVIDFIRKYKKTEKRAVKREQQKNGHPFTIDEVSRKLQQQESPSQRILLDERKKLLKLAFQQLTQTEQDIISRHDKDGLSFAEIAKLSQKTEASLRKQYLRALKHWQAEYQLLNKSN